MTNAVIQRPCPVCNSTGGRVKYRSRPVAVGSPVERGFAYQQPGLAGPAVQCLDCSCLYINPVEQQALVFQSRPDRDGNSTRLLTSRDLRDISGTLDEQAIQAYMLEERPKRRNARHALDRIVAYAQPPGKLLDVGCSCGLFLDEARRQGWNTVGIEPQPAQAIFARGHFGLEVATGTLQDIPLPVDSFDAVTSFQVFEHLLDPTRDLASIHALLKPGGVLLVEVPNLATLPAKILRSRHRHFVLDHLNYFTPQTLKELLVRSGFQPREIYFPARFLRFGHLVLWAGRYTGLRLQSALLALVRRVGLENRTVNVNLKDIVGILATR